MIFEVDRERLGVLRRALKARSRDMQQRLGGQPGDEGCQREAMLIIELLRQVDALEGRAGHLSWGAEDVEILPRKDQK